MGSPARPGEAIIGAVKLQQCLRLPRRQSRLPCNVKMTERSVRAGSDPAVFQSEKVLRALKEPHEEGPKEYFKHLQLEITPRMRQVVAEWMLEVCEEEQSHPELFCLAVNCLDRFLSKVQIKKSQLQLLASACLLVLWKVREHRKITALKIVKYTNYNVQQEELLEWEVLVLSKLNWNIPPVVAMDFVEHIVQGLGKLQVEWVPDMTRSRTQSLIFQSHINHKLASYPPSVIAASCVLVAIRPVIEMPPPRLDTPSPSSISSTSSISSPELTRSSFILSQHTNSRTSPFRTPESPIPRVQHPTLRSPEVVLTTPRSPDLDRVIRSVQKITFVEKSILQRCMEELEDLSRDGLPPSPSPDSSFSDTSSLGSRFSTSSPLPNAARTLFTDLEVKTPTKVLEAASSISN